MFTKTVNKPYIVLIAAWLAIFLFCSILSGVASSASVEELDTSKQSAAESNKAQDGASSDTPDPDTTDVPETTDDPIGIGDLPQDPSNSQYVIFLDAGHGWYDNGCMILDRTDIYEKDITLAVTKKLQTALESMGYTVRMIRENDIDCLEELDRGTYDSIRRIKYANANGGDFFISLHIDSFPQDPLMNGTRIYYRDKLEESGQFADRLATQISEVLHIKKPLLKNDVPLNVIEYSTMPSVLIEMGFATNQQDAENMLNEEWQKQFAYAIAQGIDAHIHSAPEG